MTDSVVILDRARGDSAVGLLQGSNESDQCLGGERDPLREQSKFFNGPTLVRGHQHTESFGICVEKVRNVSGRLLQLDHNVAKIVSRLEQLEGPGRYLAVGRRRRPCTA